MVCFQFLKIESGGPTSIFVLACHSSLPPITSWHTHDGFFKKQGILIDSFNDNDSFFYHYYDCSYILLSEFSFKAKQSEAKTNLSSIYAAQRAFHKEWAIYNGCFNILGFVPSGNLNYYFTNKGPGLKSFKDKFSSELFKEPCQYQSDNCDTFSKEQTKEEGAKSGHITNRARHIANQFATEPTTTTFKSSAASDLGTNKGVDVWTIDQNKSLENLMWYGIQ